MINGIGKSLFQLFFISALLFSLIAGAQASVNIYGEICESGLGSSEFSSSINVNQRGAVLDVLDLKKMDILDVLRLISQKSGLNIIAGGDVKGEVTVFLRNVDAKEALGIIVEAYGWASIQDGDIMKVMTCREYEEKYGHQFGQEIETEILTLSYAKAEDISIKIIDMLTPSIGTVKADGRSNRIIVSDTAEKIARIKDVIKAFDRKNREVLIEAKILQITLSDEHKLGVDWGAIVDDFHGLNMTGDFDVLGSTDKRGTLGIGALAADQYKVLIEALEMMGETEILSSPRIMALNNEEAKILVGSTEPYVTTTTTTPSSGPATTAESVSFIDVGIKLYVTPTIHEDDFITMKIKPEVSSVTGNVTTSHNNTIPIVETSEAETTVSVKDQVTIVIGGLIREEKVKMTKQVPLLGSIPFLGAAFRNTSDLVRKTEIVLFLTPKIITGDVAEKFTASNLK